MRFRVSALQEVIKVIIQQYIPANNTFIFNGITGMHITQEF